MCQGRSSGGDILAREIAVEKTLEALKRQGLSVSGVAMPYVLKAMGVPIEVVARCFVEIAAQQPGKVTGKTYSLLSGLRLMRGIGLLLWYCATGKIKTNM